MIGCTRVVVVAILLSALTAAGGGWLGVQYGLAHAPRSPVSLNRVLHRQLDLTPAQRQQLATLEAAYAARRKVLEAEERSANRKLAAALLAEHRYGPQAARAITRFSAAMTALQVATVQHVMAMRSVLTPRQAQTYDHAVAKALDSSGP